MLANIHLNPGIVLDPSLTEVVEKLALKHPSWVFRSISKVDGAAYSGYESHLRDVAHNAERTDGSKYTRFVTVLQDDLNAGSIHVDRAYSRRSDQNWRYEIRSPRIENGRNGNTIQTRDAAVAVRAASRNFLAPSLPEMLHKAVDAARDSLNNTLRDLARPLERGQFSPPLATMQISLYNLLKGVPFDERAIRDAFLRNNFEEALANFELAQQMQVQPVRGVIVFRGNYVYLNRTMTQVAEGKPTGSDPAPYDKDEVIKGEVHTRAFEELPQAWQDKIAVLQLMKDTELVLNVGYRFNESTFLIVE
jgi:hypothetical protein